MKLWNGLGCFQWEHTRTWCLKAAGVAGDREITRAEGVLYVPSASPSLSFFFRKKSQPAAGDMELFIWTAPVYYDPLDQAITSLKAIAAKVALEGAGAASGAGGLKMRGADTAPAGGAFVYAGKPKAVEVVGSLLFWEMVNNAAADGDITGDLYVQASHMAVVTSPGMARLAEALACPPGRGVAYVKGE